MEFTYEKVSLAKATGICMGCGCDTEPNVEHDNDIVDGIEVMIPVAVGYEPLCDGCVTALADIVDDEDMNIPY